MHTVTRPTDKTPQHRPVYPPAAWAVIDVRLAEIGVPPWPRPL